MTTFNKDKTKQQTSSTPTQVRFNQKVTIRKIPHHQNLTSQETSRIWYQDSDYQQIDDENDTIVDIMMIEEDYDDNNISSSNSESIYCTRGLEGLLPDRARALQKRRRALWDAVIDEQLIQWSSGIEDPEAIANVYRKASVHPSDRIAYLRGLIDEKLALEMYETSDCDCKEGRKKNKKNNKQLLTSATMSYSNKNKLFGRKISKVPSFPAMPPLPSPKSCQKSWSTMKSPRRGGMSLLPSPQTSLQNTIPFVQNYEIKYEQDPTFVIVAPRRRSIVWEY